MQIYIPILYVTIMTQNKNDLINQIPAVFSVVCSCCLQ